MINKIGVIGGGNIGGVLVHEIVSRHLARNVGLVDVKPPEFAKGKCLDIAEGNAVLMTRSSKAPTSSSTPRACPAPCVPTAPSPPARNCWAST